MTFSRYKQATFTKKLSVYQGGFWEYVGFHTLGVNLNSAFEHNTHGKSFKSPFCQRATVKPGCQIAKHFDIVAKL